MIQDRIEFLQARLENGEAALIASPSNRLYYTGFASSDGFVAVTKGGAYFLIDSRYVEKARTIVKSCEVILLQSLYAQLKDIFTAEGVKTVFLETGYVSLDRFSVFKERLSDFTFSTDRRLQETITAQRSVKAPAEVALIRKAQKMTDDTFSYILDRIAPGRTEREIMLDMEFYMRRLGSEGVAFDFIVVSGKNSSLPHGVPTDKKIEVGDFVTMDFGAVCDGYRADMTRTVAVGAVTEKQREVYETVLAAQRTAIGAIKPGAVCKAVDKTARDIISAAGYGDCFGHGLGHSVGLDIHEMPACNTSCTTVLESGMIMTVEPGIYLENEFGVRIEDLVCVTDDGCENLTGSRKELIIL